METTRAAPLQGATFRNRFNRAELAIWPILGLTGSAKRVADLLSRPVAFGIGPRAGTGFHAGWRQAHGRRLVAERSCATVYPFTSDQPRNIGHVPPVGV